MKHSRLKVIVQNQAYRLVFIQLALVCAFACIALLAAGRQSGFSMLMGGAAYVLPNLFFVWRVFRFAGAQEMSKFLGAFMLGETLKLIFSAFLFLVIVKYLPVSLLSTLIGFIGAIVAFWVACMWQFSRQQAK